MAKAKKKSKAKLKTKSKVKAKKSTTKVQKKSAPKKAAKKKPAKKQSSKKSSSKKVVKKLAAKKPVKKTAAQKGAKKSAVSHKAAKPSSKPWEKLIQPLSDRLVVRVEGPSERTVGGLYIPATVEDRPNQGEVLACGPGAKSKKGHVKPLDVKVGDRVLFNTYAGVPAELQGEEVLILREDEVLGVLA